ncbi:channel subfamily K member 2 [Seminavis robusta]|uniref:Channel subfamily K member 2 n=1 Tax=Seminavis robusta TaxID=568900 RepID=A0A9N8HQV5_9STRA|nr:channel subfamily K member 2 [Seminavis robusta]|eukprot:Sro1489_g276970.1 channel subfamily K member 2 (663) ;mRNA; f:18224-20301
MQAMEMTPTASDSVDACENQIVYIPHLDHRDGKDDTVGKDNPIGDSDPNDPELAPLPLVDGGVKAMAKATSFGSEDDRRSKERCLRRSCRKCYREFAAFKPRLFAVSFGFILPLLSLVVLAALCGYPLALMESPLELQQNDLLLAAQMRMIVQGALYTNLTQRLPLICLRLHFANWTAEDFMENVTTVLAAPEAIVENITDAIEHLVEKKKNQTQRTRNTTAANATNSSPTTLAGTIISDVVVNETIEEVEDFLEDAQDTVGDMWNVLSFNQLPEIPDDYVAYINATELSLYLTDCGAQLSPVIDAMFFSLASTARSALTDDITFAWSRCPTNATALDLPTSIPPSLLLDYLLDYNPDAVNLTTHPHNYDAQNAYYRHTWEKDRIARYQYYHNSDLFRPGSPEKNGTLWKRIWAFEKSLREATGGAECHPNIPAAGWFWFTVMTTIGYGNTSPVSWGGKAMVFTLGFISIILFGFVSTRAAYVITSLMDDLLIRINLRSMVQPWAEVILWGNIAFVWMIAIAAYYVQWQRERLGKDGITDMATGYWFAFISTTTVGFGDYYLAPEVMEVSDLFTYPVMFLLGFSLLAAFLSKLSQLVVTPFGEGPDLVEHFQAVDELKRSLREDPRDDGNLRRRRRKGSNSGHETNDKNQSIELHANDDSDH